MTFTESNLQFDFDQTWSDLVKYDEHPAVRQAAGSGLSCIDFLGILDGNKVVFFEVKNFKNRPAIQHPSIVDKLLPDSQSKDDMESPLVKTIVKNVKDTLLFLAIFSARNQVVDASFWTAMKQKLEDAGNEIHFILWLEMDASYPNLTAQLLRINKAIIENKLAQRLNWLTNNVAIRDIATNPFPASLTVSVI